VPPRYELLDGLRGLAALAVVLHHLQVVADGHFAVMVFFVISGYCITASADSARRKGHRFRGFLRRRIRRIYPPYWDAIALFVVTRAIKAAMGGPNELYRPLHVWIQNLTLTQWLSDLRHPITWPSENPDLFVPAFWSLNYEEQFYIVMAIFLAFCVRSQRSALIAPVLMVAVLGLALNFSIPGNWICGFFIEYWVHFALGACLYFALCVYTGWRGRLAFIAGMVLLGSACAARLLPWTAVTNQQMRTMVELAFLSAFTLGLFFLRPLSPYISRMKLWRPVAALGTISYSLYLVHQFNVHLIESLSQRILPGNAPFGLRVTTMIALHLGLATVFWYFCERPFVLSRTGALELPRNGETRRLQSL